MNNYVDEIIFLAVGMIWILLTYPVIRKIDISWQWIWSFIVLLAYYGLDRIFENAWAEYEGKYTFFAYIIGCTGGSLCLSVRCFTKRRNKALPNKSGEGTA